MRRQSLKAFAESHSSVPYYMLTASPTICSRWLCLNSSFFKFARHFWSQSLCGALSWGCFSCDVPLFISLIFFMSVPQHDFQMWEMNGPLPCVCSFRGASSSSHLAESHSLQSRVFQAKEKHLPETGSSFLGYQGCLANIKRESALLKNHSIH